MQNKLEPIYKEVIELMKKSGQSSFAVFDFDNTCIVNDIEDTTFAYIASNNLFKDKNILKGKFKNYSEVVFKRYYELADEGKARESCEFLAKTLNGFSISEINSIVEEVINFEGSDIKPVELFGRKITRGIKPREQAVKLLNFLKENGVEVWVISASPEILVNQTLKHFGIDAKAIGFRNIIVGGIITSELEKPLSIAEGKVECIKKLIDKEKRPLLGIGDGITDLPMLEYCKIKVVVDRQNALSEYAKQNNWFLI